MHPYKNHHRHAGGGKAVVTGGLGFVGAHLVRELRRRGRFVTIVDDGSNASARARAEFESDEQIQIIDAPADEQRLRAAAAGAAEIYHLASCAGVRRVARDPVFVYIKNRNGASAAVRAAAASGARLLFVSSSEVYGSGAPGRRFRESDAPGFCYDRAFSDGRAAYALSKWEGELLTMAAAALGLRAVVVRPFNIIGPGQSLSSGSLIPTFVRAAVLDEPLRVDGDGSQTRAFANAADAARAFVELLNHDRAAGRIVNVGGSEVASVAEIANTVRAAARSRSRILYQQCAQGAGVMPIAHRAPHLGLLAELLGWAPSGSIEGPIRAALDEERRAACAGAIP